MSRCEIDSHQIIVVTQVVVRADGEKKVLKKDQVQQASGLSMRSIEEGLNVLNKGQVQQGKWIKKNCTHICLNFNVLDVMNLRQCSLT